MALSHHQKDFLYKYYFSVFGFSTLERLIAANADLKITDTHSVIRYNDTKKTKL